MLKLLRRLQYWIRHRRNSQDLADEMEFHRSVRQDDFERSGLPKDEAAFASRRVLGSVLLAREDARGVWIWPWLDGLWQDLAYAGRTLLRGPAFAVAAILTLALGVGANTAVFSAVNAVLLRPLPFRDPARLVMMWERNQRTGKDRDPVAPPNFEDWKKQTPVFEAMAAYRPSGFVMTGLGEPEQIRTLSTSASLFATLGVDALFGRTFTDEEERKRDRLLVLSYAFWQRRFAGDRSVIGKSVNLGVTPFVIVGIMPPQFRFPENLQAVDTYSPLVLNDSDMRRDVPTLTVVARLKNGANIEDATTELNGVAGRINKQYPESNPEISILGIHDVFVENVRTGVLVAFGAVVSFLLIACANVANLKLAQGLRRGREIAVRTSLGATRRRIMRQLVTESLMLSVLGGAVGLLLAWATIAAVPAFRPNLFPTGPVRLDWWVLAFNLIVSIATGILFGIVPAWQVSQANLNETIKATGPSARRQVARRTLVVAEVTFSIVLAIAGGLMVRTLFKVRAVDYGFRPENVFTIQLVVSPARYPADPGQYKPRTPNSPPAQLSALARLYNDLVERLKAAPGVQSAAAVSSLPLNRVGVDFDLPVYIEGRPKPPAGEAPQADFRIATADYFKTMQIQILQGRAFSESDGPNTPDVIVINDTLARQVIGSENPIGKRIVLYGRPREIVGVYESVRHRGFRIDPTAEMVVPSRQFHQFGGMTIVLRSALDPGSLESLVKRELRQIDPDLPASNARTMESLLSDSVAQPHLTTILMGSFALLGIVLAGIGLYGVMSYTVSQRIREIGIRMALGARHQSVLRLFLRETLSLAMIGIICGLAAALGVTRLMRGVLFGVAPSDPATYAICALVLMLAALVAAYGPARRATRVDPLKALRHE